MRTTDDEDEKEIFGERYFTTDEASDHVDLCIGDDSFGSSCRTNPEECEDCDGDGTRECWTSEGHCQKFYLFDFVDECVPAGNTTYTLIDLDFQQEEFSEDILVEDKESGCAGCSAVVTGERSSSSILLIRILGMMFDDF